MKKRWFAVGVVLLVVSLLVVGCGVPQEEHDAVLAGRDAAQAEVALLQSDLTEVQSDLATAQSQVSSLRSDLTVAQSKVSDLEGFKTELGSLWDSLNEKLTLQLTIAEYWNGAAWVGAGEKSESVYLIEVALLMIATTVVVGVLGNAEIIELWGDFITYTGEGREMEAMGSIAALTDLLHDLIDQDIAAIEAELSK